MLPTSAVSGKSAPSTARELDSSFSGRFHHLREELLTSASCRQFAHQASLRVIDEIVELPEKAFEFGVGLLTKHSLIKLDHGCLSFVRSDFLGETLRPCFSVWATNTNANTMPKRMMVTLCSTRFSFLAQNGVSRTANKITT
jgi:hypothetical protein